jgi:hypothetical protein
MKAKCASHCGGQQHPPDGGLRSTSAVIVSGLAASLQLDGLNAEAVLTFEWFQ